MLLKTLIFPFHYLWVHMECSQEINYDYNTRQLWVNEGHCELSPDLGSTLKCLVFLMQNEYTFGIARCTGMFVTAVALHRLPPNIFKGRSASDKLIVNSYGQWTRASPSNLQIFQQCLQRLATKSTYSFTHGFSWNLWRETSQNFLPIKLVWTVHWIHLYLTFKPQRRSGSRSRKYLQNINYKTFYVISWSLSRSRCGSCNIKKW